MLRTRVEVLDSGGAVADRSCAWCGEPFRSSDTRKKYCSYECGHPDMRSRKGIAARRPPADCHRVCPWCLMGFDAASTRQVFCSRPCRWQASSYRRYHGVEPPRGIGARQTIPCGECGIEFVDCLPHPSTVCAQCAATVAAERTAKPVLSLVCAVCSSAFTSTNPTARCCSPPCSSEHRRRTYSRKSKVRRARLSGTTDVEFIDPIDIFTRDGWRCQICGGKVWRRAKWPHPKSAVLDHIVPLSCDGPHVRSNVQCAHNHCNGSKGARAANDQLRLL